MIEMTEAQWKQHATQKSLDIVESFYNILKIRDAEIKELHIELKYLSRLFELHSGQPLPPRIANLLGKINES